MSSILDLIGEQLGPETIRQMSGSIGAEPRQTAAAVETAVPLLLGALQRNSATEGGGMSLLGALDRDHDGSILDDVAGFLGQGPTASQERSIDHIFGDRRGGVENAVARRSGLGRAQVMQLLMMLAPLILGAIGRARRSPGADSGTGGLGDLLGGAVGKMQQQSPGLGGLLGGLLDSDGDGSMLDDLLEKGLGSAGGATSRGGGGGGLSDLGGLLGGLLGGGRR